MKVWSWRHAVIESDLPSTTKLVLLALSVYMNECGEGCYPSQERIMANTSLGRTAVIEHINLAEKRGWLRKSKHGYSGQKWKRNEYHPLYPKGTELGAVPSDSKGIIIDDTDSKETENSSDSSPKGTDSCSVPLDEKDSSLDEPPSKKVVRQANKGSPPGGKKVVRQVNTNTAYNTSLNDDDPRARGNDDFDIDDFFSEVIEVAQSPNCINRIVIEDWIERGADPYQDILPAIETTMHRTKGIPPNSPKYFEPEIFKSVARKVEGKPPPENQRKFDKAYYISLTGRRRSGDTLDAEEIEYIEAYEEEQRKQAKITKPKLEPARASPELKPLDLTIPGNQKFQKVRDRLKQELGEATFNAWLQPLRLDRIEYSVVYMTLPSRFMCDEVSSRYKDVMLESWQEINPQIENVEITVEGYVRVIV